jgi:hypothetical protein
MTMIIDDICDDSVCRCNEKTTSLVEAVQKMRERECDYTVSDYLHQPSLLALQDPVDITCRSQMIEWIVNIVDHCKFSRSTASIAINFMDRFLMATEWALADRSAFQLASITCLYTAIKIHELTVLSIDSIASLTRNLYRKEQIESMERLILDANRWLMNPSTSFTFGDYLCEVVALMDVRHNLGALKELTTLQIESTMQDYELGLLPSSTVAFAAVMNAVDSMDVTSPEDQQAIGSSLQSLLRTDPSLRLQDIRIRLYEGILVAETTSAHFMMARKNLSGCGSSTQLFHSPRTVSNLRVVSP